MAERTSEADQRIGADAADAEKTRRAGDRPAAGAMAGSDGAPAVGKAAASGETKQLTCVTCPKGCSITVAVEDGAIASVEGAGCRRGEKYARAEATNPQRTVTASLCVPGCLEPLSVRTAEPVPKARMADVVRAISQLAPQLPIEMDQVVCPDVAGTGVAVVATKRLPA